MVVASLVLAAGAMGCFHDKSETIEVTGTLAVGGYGNLSFGDSCPGSKADLCSRETVVAIDAFTVDPPGALEVLPASDVPADLLQLWAYQDDYVVHGLAPAHATLCVQAQFSDGTHRKACAPVDVDVAARIVPLLACDTPVGTVTPGPLVLPGRDLPFYVELFAADGTELGGEFLHPIDDSALVPIALMTYLWRSPAAGGSLTLGSTLVPTFAETLATYGPDQVTGVVAGADLSPPTILAAGKALNVQVAVDVGGVRACVGPQVVAKTETPAVCLGPNGEAAWSVPGGGSITSFTAVAEGTCQLSVGIAGGSGYPGTFSVPFYFLNPQDQGRDSTIGSYCSAPGQQTCEATRESILVCTGARQWAVASSCNGTLCDYTAAAPCAAGSGCVACR